MPTHQIPSASFALLRRLSDELDLDLDADAVLATSSDRTAVPLPSCLAVGELAWASVLTAGAALSRGPLLGPAPRLIAAAYRSDRHLRVDGAAPSVWSPLSRFWPTADGWVRTHGNYPHHERALRQGLDIAAGSPPEEIGARLAGLASDIAAARVSTAGGLCVAVRHEQPEVDASLREDPLVTISRKGDASRRELLEDPRAPLLGVRVLDLTRVIAGPVATRTLALAGAEVLRIDSPRRPELAWQHLDTGHGKRSALLDITADPARFEELLALADTVVLGYRPDALRRLGLSPDALTQRHPHLVVAQLSAWPGDDSRRGFDSLVQADSGISWIESSDGLTPGALPAQALDHSAGYLLAAGIATALRRRAADGGSWHVRISLRRVAAELLGMPRQNLTGTSPDEARSQTFEIEGYTVTTVVPAVTWPQSPDVFPAPRPWGRDQAEWLPRPA